jgi:hypothetical protein
MDSSAFDSAIRALDLSVSKGDASLDRLTWWLIACNIIVVVGLFVEYHDDVKEFFTGRPRTRRNWKMSFTGGVLVILGIFGELAVTFVAHRVELGVRSDNQQKDCSVPRPEVLPMLLSVRMVLPKKLEGKPQAYCGIQRC